MARLLLTIVATVAFVAFSLSNTQRIEVSFVIGEPVETRLIFVLMISFGLGAVGALFHRMWQEANRRAQYRRMRHEVKKAALKELGHG